GQMEVPGGAGEIPRTPHNRKAGLGIPPGANRGQGPARRGKAAGGRARPAAASAAATSRIDSAPSESRVTSVAVAASPTTAKADAALKAKLSLDPEPAPKPAKPALAPPSKPPIAKSSAPSPSSSPAPSPPTPSHDTLALSAAASGSGAPSGVVLGGVALLALAAVAFYVSRRRAVGNRRHIQILETASLGPKRALVVARVGDATLILGSSEAGITLLQSVPDPDAAKQGGGGTVMPELSFAPAAPFAVPA